ncbi:MAG TPA: CinA family protein [Pseudobdellovibrionaceae bacterium]|nr:CinA family protein [Pseudobdellovibrionaceae bacterium]
MTTSLDSLLQILRAHGWTVSFAESCTGGQLSSMLTAQAGISDVFMGSVVSYSNKAKTELLGVKPETLLAKGAVSEPVALEMAGGARGKFHTNWAVAITGIAGPSGGTPEKPVGTACFAVSGRWDSEERNRSVTCRFDGDRNSIQSQSVEYAIGMLVAEMNKK